MKILVTGAGGFIGTHLVSRLKKDGHFVVGVDIKKNEWKQSDADFFVIHDLSDQTAVDHLFRNFQFDQVFNLAALMGGMEFLADGNFDYDVLSQSTLININIIDAAIKYKVKKIFFSSSACIYNYKFQEKSDNVSLKENVHDYPSLPDLEYGWQKLFSERLYMAGQRCNPIQARIARFHNVYGPFTEYQTNKAKAPAALCAKISKVDDGGTIEVIGDGEQSRSFMWISDCIDGIIRLMASDCAEPINIGSDELTTINNLVRIIIERSGKKNVFVRHVDGPQGVRGRNSDNDLVKQKLGWAPSTSLVNGVGRLYEWVNKEVQKTFSDNYENNYDKIN